MTGELSRKKPIVNIVWFKKDLRSSDHKPLSEAASNEYPVLPLYVFEPDYWEQKDTSQRHWEFTCLLYTSPSPRDATLSRMPSSA